MLGTVEPRIAFVWRVVVTVGTKEDIVVVKVSLALDEDIVVETCVVDTLCVVVGSKSKF